MSPAWSRRRRGWPRSRAYLFHPRLRPRGHQVRLVEHRGRLSPPEFVASRDDDGNGTRRPAPGTRASAFARARRLARSPSTRRTSRSTPDANTPAACAPSLCRVCASARIRQIRTVGTQRICFFFPFQHAGALVSDCAAPIGRTRVGWVRNDGPSSSRRRVNTSTHERTTCTTITASYRSRSSSSPLPPTLQRAPPPPRRPRRERAVRARMPRRSLRRLRRLRLARELRDGGSAVARDHLPGERAHLSVRVRHLQQHVRVVLLPEGAPQARPLGVERASSRVADAWRRRRRTPATTLCAPRRTARRGRAPRFPRGRTP